jgi:hypothetical protein
MERERFSEQECGPVSTGDLPFLYENNTNQGSQGQHADCIVIAVVPARNAKKVAPKKFLASLV